VQGGGGELSTPGVSAVPVRQDLAGVVEQDDTVAQQAPALLGMAGNDLGGVTVDAVDGRATRLVGALRTADVSTHIASLYMPALAADSV